MSQFWETSKVKLENNLFKGKLNAIISFFLFASTVIPQEDHTQALCHAALLNNNNNYYSGHTALYCLVC